MDLPIGSRFKRAWNAFLNRDPTYYNKIGTGYSYRPDRPRFTRGNARSLVTPIYNRIAMDVASVDIRHVRLDQDDRFLEYVKSDLDNCLTVEANIDQTGREFLFDAAMSLIDEGCIALVPVDTDTDPEDSTGFKILTMRTGRILDWYPAHVRLEVYNEQTGRKEQVIMPKRSVAIVESPFYAVINETNSVLQRLIRKLNLLDAVDEQASSGKLDLIIQLPYTVKTEMKRSMAEKRRKDMEEQLNNSKYGVAYMDSTERITQLNRPIDNNLLKQIESLTSMLYSQLGITQEILNGTADEKTMENYYNRTIEPIVSALVNAMRRTFLSKTARTQKQSIMFFRDPFKLVPASEMAEIADKFTRNEILSSNEIRQGIGIRPSKDPKADELRNSNNAKPDDYVRSKETGVQETLGKETNQNGTV